MKIAVDIDDVLSETQSLVAEDLSEKLGLNLKKEDFKDTNWHEYINKTKEESYKLFQEFVNKRNLEIKVKKGAKEAIIKLSKKHEIIAVTSRSFLIYKDTKLWLNTNFPEIKKLFHVSDYPNMNDRILKSDICVQENAKVLIEDQLNLIKDCKKKGIHVIILDAPWNQNSPKNIKKVFSWPEIIKEINYINQNNN